MQSMNLRNIKEIKRKRMVKMEEELKDEITGRVDGELFLCPICKYESKNSRKGTAKIFKNTDGTTAFKCFACGRWRKL